MWYLHAWEDIAHLLVHVDWLSNILMVITSGNFFGRVGLRLYVPSCCYPCP